MYENDRKQNKTINKYRSDSIDKINDQCMIDACSNGNLSLIKTYLRSGYEINKFLNTGWTLLLYAASYSQPKLVQYLIHFGGDPNLHYDGYTPLMSLCNSIKGLSGERMKCLKYLLEAKVDVNAVNKFKETAFMYACKVQDIDFILVLLKYITDINFADSENRTALFYAVNNNRYDVTKILIENGADINWTNYEGLKAYDIALFKRYEKLIPLLTINCGYKKKNIETNYISSWIDIFSTTKEIKKNCIDNDIMNLLYGMRLENYEICFCGINLKRFLRLKEEEVEKLGVDISVHRKRFINELFIFYKQPWKNNLLKINKSDSITAIESLTLLGNINKQLVVISSSIYFSSNYLTSIEDNKELNFNSKYKRMLKTESRNMQKIVLKIKSTTNQIKSLAQIIHKQNSDLSLPILIKKNTNKNKTKWFIIPVIITVSFYFYKRCR